MIAAYIPSHSSLARRWFSDYALELLTALATSTSPSFQSARNADLSLGRNGRLSVWHDFGVNNDRKSYQAER